MSIALGKAANSVLGDFDYNLPTELIAQYPLPTRTDSRLLTLSGKDGGVEDCRFADIKRLLAPGDVLVLNDTRVIPARLHGRKATGGQVELLIERVLDQYRVLAMAGTNKPLRAGHRIDITKRNAAVSARVIERRKDLFVIAFENKPVSWVLQEFGRVPLPPYIQRPDQNLDRDRYQTVYAAASGAVAAPTAGLHFDHALLSELEVAGVRCVFLTLHVGSGTFQPIRTHSVCEHHMHPEWISVPSAVCDAIVQARREGNRVVAVGTTSVRALETLARQDALQAYAGETSLFLYPGQPFGIVDAMITNFHLPKSSLLMLVCAYAGTDNTLRAYQHAVQERYRFFSYGDAMFVTPHPSARLCLDSV